MAVEVKTGKAAVRAISSVFLRESADGLEGIANAYANMNDKETAEDVRRVVEDIRRIVRTTCPVCGGREWWGGTDANPRPECKGCGEPQMDPLKGLGESNQNPTKEAEDGPGTTPEEG